MKYIDKLNFAKKEKINITKLFIAYEVQSLLKITIKKQILLELKEMKKYIFKYVENFQKIQIEN